MREGHFDRFAADGHPVEKSFAVEVFDGGNACSVGLGLQVSPFDELGQRVLNGFEGRRSIGPAGFGEHVVRAQVQTELAFGRGEQVQDGAVVRAVLSYHVAEQKRSGGMQGGVGHPVVPIRSEVRLDCRSRKLADAPSDVRRPSPKQ